MLGACSSETFRLVGSDPELGSGSTETPPPASLDAALQACGTVDRFEGRFDTAVPVYLLPEAAVGQRFADPNFGNCLTRLTDHNTDPTRRFARNTYPRRSPYNADSSRVLIQSGDGSLHLYDPERTTHIAMIDGVRGAAEPLWHPTDPERLFHVSEEGVGMQLLERRVGSGSSRVIGDLGARLRARWPNAAVASTRSEGHPSRDFRYWAFIVETAQREPLGVVVWDHLQDQILATRDAGSQSDQIGVDIDWVSMSPSGDYVVVSADEQTLAWTRDLQLHGVLHDNTEHSDIAIGADGRDVYVSIDFDSVFGEVFMRHLDTLERTDLYSSFVYTEETTRYSSLHISGKAFERPGWVIVSNYRTRSPVYEWFHNTILLVELAANPRIERLATHHSQYAGYWTEPHASPNADLTHVIFNSNWYSGNPTDVNAWQIDIDDDVLR